MSGSPAGIRDVSQEANLRSNTSAETGHVGTWPVFVTRYSLSSKTAIGVQTKHYLEAFQDWLHLYWREFDSGIGRDKRSIRIEGFVVARWPFWVDKIQKIPGLRRFGAARWSDQGLKQGPDQNLVARFRDRTSALYFAPVDAVDAARMRHMAELLGKPFVLHLWDSLGTPLLESESHVWLIRHAHQVYVLSKPLLHEAREVRSDIGELLFVREKTASRATAPGAGPLRVALIGFLPAYRTGLHLLHEAILQMRGAGVTIELHYVGARRALDRLQEDITKEMHHTGYLPSHEARDAALASCHVAFLPGPLESPAEDFRSRYSIPSRVLDFMAVGLPVVGAVHPDSATALFYKEYGVGKYLECGTPEQIAEAFTALKRPDEWAAAHQASLAALERIDCEGQLDRLKRAMNAAAVSVNAG